MILQLILDDHKFNDAEGKNAGPSSHAPRSLGRILVIDDEESILFILMRALEERGYQVDGCESGKKGLAYLSKYPYVLVICDIRLPDTSGPKVYKVVQAEHLEMIDRMIFTTGDIVSPDVQRFLDESGSPILKKPFDLPELHRLMEEVLKHSSDRSPSP